MNPAELTDEANARLEELYRPRMDAWREIRASHPELSIPMFLKATPAYFAGNPRIVFVGQETHGWWTDCKIADDQITAAEVMDFYQGVDMTNFRIHSPSPFWRAIRELGSLLGQTGYPAPVISANLFPCDVAKTRAPESLLETMRSWKLLPAELKILAPDVVIFLVGPIYAWNLSCYFGTPVEPKLSSKNLFQPYSPPEQAWKGWITYHPKRLRLSRNWAVIDVMAESIRRSVAE
jgi:hypothetical protein